MTSSDGVELAAAASRSSAARLADGAKAGYTRNPNGSFDIQTTTAGSSPCSRRRRARPRPRASTARFSHGQLVL